MAAHFKTRQTGVSTSLAAVLTAQAGQRAVAALGYGLPEGVPHLPWRALLGGWRPPPGRRCRIWHARRAEELAFGVLLRDLLRQPWKLVCTVEVEGMDHPLFRALERRLDALVVTVPAGLARARHPRALLIPHGVDTSAFRPAPDREGQWRALGLPGRHGILNVARIRPQKGQDVLVEAACRVLPRHPEAALVFAGLITEDNQAFAEGLRRRLAAAGLLERTVFLGHVPAAMIAALYRGALLYVQCARSEGFGLTPLEAMASGTAVVSTRVGAAADLVREGETGHLCPPDDPEAMAELLEARLSDLPGTLAMGRRAREEAVAHHGIEREASALLALYDELLTPGAAS
ncbi:MAG: glycosyltransferase [Rhodovarius sp.]|nr:glycosyltransferase [Rhodovarius sp.]